MKEQVIFLFLCVQFVMPYTKNYKCYEVCVLVA